MNISQPVPSSINGVTFGLLSPQDVTKLSVQQITNPVTFDQLLNPNPCGLYDPALGAILSNKCATCRLDARSCPGHCGHIELPVKVFHCVFIDQAYRLLRAQCHYCHRLRMSKVETHRYWCKLKLIRHGLIDQAEQVDKVGHRTIKRKERENGLPFGQGLAEDEQPYEMEMEDFSDDAADDTENLTSKRTAFVKQCIKDARRRGIDLRNVHQDEAILASRKRTIAEFKDEMVRPQGSPCQNCKAISPPMRKDRAKAIFRKPFSEKHRYHNTQNKIKMKLDPLTDLNKEVKRQRQKALKSERSRAAEAIDEGVADMESSPSEDPDDTGLMDEIGGESSERSEEEQEVEQMDETGIPTVVQTNSTAPKAKKRSKQQEPTRQTFLNASEIHAFLVQLFAHESEILHMVYQTSPDGPAPTADMFFIQSILVPPNKFRPESKTGQDEISEPPEHEAYKRVLTLNREILQIRRELQGQSEEARTRLRTYDDLQRNWINLQEAINAIFDSDKSGVRGLAALRVPDGIKQRLEKKEGMFRMNIMGKRVNFAARSVISPDPNIETTEIGVPPVFARTLTYPEPVTNYSFEYLKEAVKNGPKKWPGANAVEYENGQVISLHRKNDDERVGIANLLLAPSTTGISGTRAKKVHRHLNNGDMVIMNRQPTLHKPSMMCHRAKILPGEKTIRMHYANCNTYNADFDGDEMNMHFPQNELARAEALEIADTDHQYLSATAGKPLRGLIQDHVSMGTSLSSVDTFFTRAEYYELLYSCLRPESMHTEFDRVLTVDPAIMKPVMRWTGKQVITTVLMNIRPNTHAALNMESGCSTEGKQWGDEEQSKLRVVDGEVLTGTLDKKQIGPSSNGLIHSVYEVYGHTVAGKIMGILGRLLTRMLNVRAFSCGIDDLLLTDKGNALRAEKLTGAENIGLDVAAKYVGLTGKMPSPDSPELLERLESVLREEDKHSNLDLLTNASNGKLTTAIWEACTPHGLDKQFPKNQMQAMTTSGAKGSKVNANQISCNLGQQTLEGRRVPVMISGKTLPSFKPFETSIRAGGYILDRFLTGIRPQEYYFQLMAGREGLIDTAVKTSRSGYLQRCVVKGMEGLRAEHDTSVRDADGSLIQTLYGEDGLEIVKRQKMDDFTFLSKNFLSFFATNNVRDDAIRMINEDAIEYQKEARKAVAKSGNLAAMDPAISKYNPFANAGSTSESFYDASRRYINDNPDKTIRSKMVKGEDTVNKRYFQQMLHLKYARGIVEPGEAVGVVAGQSIGEPSTQMTLNTFHLAGFAAKNVTLGIPRLREILMTASRNIKKPTMTLYPIPELSKTDQGKFAKSISRLPLSQIIDQTTVEESIGGGSFTESRVYKIRLDFFPASEYTSEYAIRISDVASKIEDQFLKLLRAMIRKEIKKRSDEKSLKNVPEVGESAGRDRDQEPVQTADNEGGDSDEESGGDDDATDAKRKANLDEGMTYDDPDESEAELERQGEVEAADAVPEEESDTDEGYGSLPSDPEEGTASQKDPNDPTATTPRRISKSAASARSKSAESRVLDAYKEITAYAFDHRHGQHCTLTFEYPVSAPKILLLNLVNTAARQTLIQEVPGLGMCTATEEGPEKSKTDVIVTEGCNLKAVSKFQDILNPHRTLTNSIHDILQHFGIEAARTAIIHETSSVFSGHNIDVDTRHLTLVADYMTRGGGYSAFSRGGMKDKSSPFAKMSFETTVGFLGGAVLDGEREGVEGPSARITVGRVGAVGTGMGGVVMPVG